MTADTEGGSGPRARRARDRGFQRPSGSALVARPESLTGAEPATPATDRVEPATPEPVSVEVAPEQSTAAESAATVPTQPAPDTELPMPPARHSEIRVQFNTKLRPAVIERTKGFADRYHTNIQDIVEQALDEYMTRRGWPVNRKR